MKKHLLTLTLALIVVFNLTAQDFLSFPEGTRFFDVPGSTFLTVQKTGTNIKITEHEQDGHTRWTESFEFPVLSPDDTIILINDIKRFGDTNEYLLSVLCRQPQQGTSIFNIPSIHLSVKLSLEEQAITDTSTLLLPGGIINLAEMNDTTISIFTLRYISSDENGFEVCNINPGLDTTFIAAWDSVPYFYSDHEFKYHDNLIYNYYVWPGYIGLSKHNSNASIMSQTSQGLYGQGPFENTNVDFDVFDDQFFAFSQSYGYSSSTQWRMFLLNKNLEIINYHSFYPIESYLPTGESISYTMNDNDVIITNDYIYILGHRDNQYKDKLTIFVYNHNFDEVCQLPLNTIYNPDKAIVKINDKAYYRITFNETEHNYYLIDGCELNYLSVGETNTVDFAVYPNPSQSIFNIQNLKNEHLKIRALNLQGKEIASFNSASANIQVDLESYPNGIYLLEIISTKGKTTQRVIKL